MIARAAASVIVAGALVLGTAGCTFFAVQQTTRQYDASDGVNLTVGKVKIRNAIALVGADGRAVSLILTIVNGSDQAVQVNFGYGVNVVQQTKNVVVGKGMLANVGYDPKDPSSQLILIGTGVKAGGLLPVFVQYGNETGQTALVPVLDGSLPEYKNLVAPDIPRSTPVGTPSAAATPTHAP